MKLSSRAEYGVRAMYELACEYGKGLVSIKSITERQHISANYLEQLFSMLRKANLVEGQRGNAGGYVLTREPNDISIGDIFRAVEGPITPCERLKGQEDCIHGSFCPASLVWGKLKKSIDETLNSMSLQDMVDSKEKVDF